MLSAILTTGVALLSLTLPAVRAAGEFELEIKCTVPNHGLNTALTGKHVYAAAAGGDPLDMGEGHLYISGGQGDGSVPSGASKTFRFQTVTGVWGNGTTGDWPGLVAVLPDGSIQLVTALWSLDMPYALLNKNTSAGPTTFSISEQDGADAGFWQEPIFQKANGTDKVLATTAPNEGVFADHDCTFLIELYNGDWNLAAQPTYTIGFGDLVADVESGTIPVMLAVSSSASATA